MSYDISAAAQRLSATLDAFSINAFTLMAWVKRDADRGTFTVVMGFDDGTVSNYAILGTDGTGDLLFIEHLTGGGVTDVDVSGPTLNNTTWFFVCFVRDGTGTNSGKFYYSSSPATLSLAQVTIAATFTASRMTIGDNGTQGDFFAGKIANVKLWNAALSSGEVDAERWHIEPQRTSGLEGWWLPPGSSEFRRDYSGNGHTLTGTGGIIGILDPPVGG